jgi:hypothetical protein
VNTAEQVLRKRCQTLEHRTAYYEQVIRALLRDLEFTESVGAAFAWDLVTNVRGDYYCDPVIGERVSAWDEAVKALEGGQKEKP